MRCLLALLVVSCAAALGACGNEEEAALRVELYVVPFDGEIPSGLRLRRLDRAAGDEEVYDLAPVAGGRPGEYEAPGAPEGSYRVEGPEGWWMLHLGSTPPRLVRDRQPPRVGLGRARTIYLGAQAPGVRPSTVWGAVRVLEGGVEEPVPVTVEADEGGYLVAVRFAPEAWHGSLRIVGRVASGPPGTPPPGPDAPLTEPIQFEAEPDGRAMVTRIRQRPVSPLHVELVAAAEDVPTDERRVHVSIAGMPIPFEVDGFGYRGVARFANVPLVNQPVHLQVEGMPGDHRVAPTLLRRQFGLRLLVLGETPARRLRVSHTATPEVDLVQVRPEGAAAYGRVPFELEDGVVVFTAPRGPIDVLLRAGERWAVVSAAGDDDLEIADASFVVGVSVGGSVQRVRPGTVVRFFRVVGTGEEAVLGDGFELRVEPSGVFEGLLPTGRWLVEVAGPAGVWRRPQPLVAESPGARLHVPLEGP